MPAWVKLRPKINEQRFWSRTEMSMEVSLEAMKMAEYYQNLKRV